MKERGRGRGLGAVSSSATVHVELGLHSNWRSTTAHQYLALPSSFSTPPPTPPGGLLLLTVTTHEAIRTRGPTAENRTKAWAGSRVRSG